MTTPTAREGWFRCMRRVTALATLATLVVGTLACGPSIPPRYVVERDLGPLQYRRYQEVMDVEFPIEGNEATGHTATYLRRGRGNDVSIATAFVTVYTNAAAVTAEVRDRLDALGTYDVRVEKIEGEWMWILDGGDTPWAIWVSGRYLVKLGGSYEFDEEDGNHGIPEELLEEYTDAFPSDLDERGQAREGSDSYGQSQLEVEENEELEMPSSLRDDAPI